MNECFCYSDKILSNARMMDTSCLQSFASKILYVPCQSPLFILTNHPSSCISSMARQLWPYPNSFNATTCDLTIFTIRKPQLENNTRTQLNKFVPQAQHDRTKPLRHQILFIRFLNVIMNCRSDTLVNGVDSRPLLTSKRDSNRRVRMERPTPRRSDWSAQTSRPKVHGTPNPHILLSAPELQKQKIPRRRREDCRRNHRGYAA